MKHVKIEKDIDFCNECPYCSEEDVRGDVYCLHPANCQLKILELYEIPEWCLLPETEEK